MEQAHQLARGTFLEEDIYSDWTHARRHVLTNAQHRLLYRLADLYVQRNRQEQAEVLLQSFYAQDPTNEDALCRLMILLAQLGRSSEALQCYEQTVRQLREELDVEPQQKTRQVAGQIRQQIVQLKMFPRFAPAEQTSFSAHPSLSNKTAPMVDSLLTEMPEALYEQEGEYLARGIGYLEPLLNTGWSSHAILDMLHIVLPVVDALPESIRASLFPMDTRMKNGSILHQRQVSEEQRAHLHLALSESVNTVWKQFLTIRNDEVLIVSQLLLSLLHRTHIFLVPSARSYLYTGVYGLIGLALHCQEHNKEALYAQHNSHFAALATGDPWYVAQSLICQADTYLTLGMYMEALQALKEALDDLGEIDEEHKRARAHLLGCWADVMMTMEKYDLAQKKLDEAARYLDGATFVAEFDHACWLQLAGKKHLWLVIINKPLTS